MLKRLTLSILTAILIAGTSFYSVNVSAGVGGPVGKTFDNIFTVIMRAFKNDEESLGKIFNNKKVAKALSKLGLDATSALKAAEKTKIDLSDEIKVAKRKISRTIDKNNNQYKDLFDGERTYGDVLSELEEKGFRLEFLVRVEGDEIILPDGRTVKLLKEALDESKITKLDENNINDFLNSLEKKVSKNNAINPKMVKREIENLRRNNCLLGCKI